MNDYKHDFVTINEIKIAQHVAGTGDPVLLLHGWGAHIGLIWPLADQLVQRGYRCYALDLPGFGHSDEPPAAWTVFDYAQFVLAYLDHHELERIHLFGHSFGGRLGLILGADHGNRLYKMTLSGAAGLRPKQAIWPQVRLQTYKALRDTLSNIGLGNLAQHLRQRYNARYGSADFQQVTGTMRQTFVNVVNEDLEAYARRVKLGTLLFWGDQDQDTPLWMAQKLETTMPDAGLVIHQGAGHYAYLEHLAETARVMDYFFKQTP